MNLGTDFLDQAQSRQLTTAMIRLPHRREGIQARPRNGGRAALLEHCYLAPGQYVVELGHGAMRSSDCLTPELVAQLARVQIVESCPDRLERMRARWADLRQVEAIAGDANAFGPGAAVDGVLL